MVALSHAVSLVGEPRWFGTAPFGGHLVNLNVGVDFFFVLSGFIVTFVHWDDLGRRDRLGHYAKRRFTRVFPPYWIVLSLIVPVYLAVPSFGEPRQHDWAYIATSYVLFPMPQQPVLGVAWTLTLELFFYLLLGLMIRFGRRAAPLFGLWALAILACQLTGLRAYPFSFVGSEYGAQFLIGMAVAALLQTRRLPRADAVLGLGLLAFFLAMFGLREIQLVADGVYARLVFGIAAGLIIAGAVELERSGRLRLPAGLARPLGAASYAVYLTHVVTESALIRLTATVAPDAFSPNGMMLFLGAAGVAGGVAFHVLIERPLTAAIRRRLR
jgi:peptidoglycan/LPS O-acetylase OafA/YrhL